MISDYYCHRPTQGHCPSFIFLLFRYIGRLFIYFFIKFIVAITCNIINRRYPIAIRSLVFLLRRLYHVVSYKISGHNVGLRHVFGQGKGYETVNYTLCPWLRAYSLLSRVNTRCLSFRLNSGRVDTPNGYRPVVKVR